MVGRLVPPYYTSYNSYDLWFNVFNYGNTPLRCWHLEMHLQL